MFSNVVIRRKGFLLLLCTISITSLLFELYEENQLLATETAGDMWIDGTNERNFKRIDNKQYGVKRINGRNYKYKRKKYLRENLWKRIRRVKKKDSDIFKNDYKYCDISNIPSISMLLKNKNKYGQTLSIDDINKLKKQRLTKPKSCNNYNNNNDNNNDNDNDKNLDMDNNLLPYINRCHVLNYKNQPDLFEYYGNETSSISYMHVFKSGGSTVIDTIENVYKDANNLDKLIKVHWRYWNKRSKHRRLPLKSSWMQNKAYFYKHILENQYLFTFIRQPISRFLSGFFEYEVRSNDNVQEIYMRKINGSVTK